MHLLVRIKHSIQIRTPANIGEMLGALEAVEATHALEVPHNGIAAAILDAEEEAEGLLLVLLGRCGDAFLEELQVEVACAVHDGGV